MARAAGALVVLADGLCLAHLTRGGRTLTLFGDPAAREERAALVTRALLQAIAEGRMERLRIEEIDGERVGASGLEPAMRAAGGRISPKASRSRPGVPEGDSVWRLSERLQPLVGRTIEDSQFRVPRWPPRP